MRHETKQTETKKEGLILPSVWSMMIHAINVKKRWSNRFAAYSPQDITEYAQWNYTYPGLICVLPKAQTRHNLDNQMIHWSRSVWTVSQNPETVIAWEGRERPGRHDAAWECQENPRIMNLVIKYHLITCVTCVICIDMSSIFAALFSGNDIGGGEGSNASDLAERKPKGSARPGSVVPACPPW